MELGQWLSLLAVCLLGAMSPGPSLAIVLKCVLAGGRGAGAAAALAHGAGVGLYGLLTVTGLAVLITGSPALFLGLQIAGALYLLYLGGRALRGTSHAQLAPQAGSLTGSAAREGFLVAFLNPKLAVFMLALFSQFIEPGFGLLEKGLMALTVGVVDAAWYALVAALVSQPAFLQRLRRSAVVIDRVFGLILLLLACSVLLAALPGCPALSAGCGWARR
jgi:threonine/homoserine/homoserine lactone efflux protein